MIINLTSKHGNIMDSVVFFKNKTRLDKTHKKHNTTKQKTKQAQIKTQKQNKHKTKTFGITTKRHIVSLSVFSV